jgi:hypothetical protein
MGSIARVFTIFAAALLASLPAAPRFIGASAHPAAIAQAEEAPQIEWVRQFGELAQADDGASAAGSEGEGNFFVAGETSVALLSMA